VSGFLEEAAAEAVGASSKRWALLLIAFAAGGVIAAVLAARWTNVSRLGGERPEAPGTEVDQADSGLILADDGPA
jgi:hypothetical protein